MTRRRLRPIDWREPLLGQLRWFIRLRWMAGLIVVIAALLDWNVVRWYPEHDLAILGVGLSILAYNTLLALLLRRQAGPPPRRRRRWAASVGRPDSLASGVLAGGDGRSFAPAAPGGPPLTRALLLGLIWAQFLLDVTALMLLTLLTGGNRPLRDSPLPGLFVLHMVFAGLLLPRITAYAAASATVLIVVGSMYLSGRWPINPGASLAAVGWCCALLGTVMVSSHIARALRRQHRRLRRQNGRILAMSRQLRRQQRAIMQTEKMSALGQMAAGVAHEIANPLASMDSLLQLLQRKPERFRPETVTTLREQVERITRIVRELTTFARPSDAQWQTVPLNDVVREALGMVGFDPRFKRARVEEEFSPEVGAIPMLPQAIQQVLVNLLRNALDAMEGAGVEHPGLRVRTAREDDWCVVEVADNGPGIATGNLRKLFEPFFTTKPVGKGTGLGLSISYALVQKHGGMIGVRSKAGEGATFTIKLPAAARAEEAAGISGNPARGQTGTVGDGPMG